VNPGLGQSAVVDIQTSQNGGGNTYRNIYSEMGVAADTTSPVVAVTGTTGYPDVFENVFLGADVAGSTRYLLDIVAGGSVIARNLALGGVSPNAINDHNTGRGTISPGAFGSVAYYDVNGNVSFPPTSYFSRISSASASPASAGFGRLASGDAINFRNNANSADVNGLMKNTSDEVIVGGTAGARTQGPLTVIGGTTAGVYYTNTNCSSSASPAVCGAAPGGSVVIAAAATTVTVNTTAVTANSQIILTRDNSLGTKLGVTCNTQSSLVLGTPYPTVRVAGTSFTIGLDVAPTTNPLCVGYLVVN
jgi:hypothetical protein